MTARTINELVEAALQQRSDLIDAGKNPAREPFKVTFEERLVLLDSPWEGPPKYAISQARDRICGMKVEVSS